MACVFSGEYHDSVWGTPVRDSTELFAQLSLCTQQCGISWKIVWSKREHYGAAFHSWDMRRVAAMGAAELDGLCDPRGAWKGKLIQNRAKLAAIVHNARECVRIDEREEGGLCGFLWSFVRGRADTVNQSADCSDKEYVRVFGCTSPYSDALAAALRGKYKLKFVGSVVLQAFLLQNGLLNGHAVGCSKNPHTTPIAVVVSPKTVRASSKRRAAGGREAEDEVPASRRLC
ncbi:hypothetical protein AB1Y20_023750 [Prymnesium parvum]|uniref:DNA-3-methyladenine glycosylase I n=1 Tax=Prymnesium parvum TaxID=97485 RepID=A0AB34JI02_PRYPA